MNQRSSEAQKLNDAAKLISSATGGGGLKNSKSKEDSKKNSKRTIDKSGAPNGNNTSSRNLPGGGPPTVSSLRRMASSSQKVITEPSGSSSLQSQTGIPVRSYAPIVIHSNTKKPSTGIGKDELRKSSNSYSDSSRLRSSNFASGSHSDANKSTTGLKKIIDDRGVSSQKKEDIRHTYMNNSSTVPALETSISNAHFVSLSQPFDCVVSPTSQQLLTEKETTNVYNLNSNKIEEIDKVTRSKKESVFLTGSKSSRQFNPAAKIMAHSRPAANSLAMYKSQFISSSEGKGDQNIRSSNVQMNDRLKVDIDQNEQKAEVDSVLASKDLEIKQLIGRCSNLEENLAEIKRQSEEKEIVLNKKTADLTDKVLALGKQVELYSESNKILENQVQALTHEASSVFSNSGIENQNDSPNFTQDDFNDLEREYNQLFDGYEKLKKENLILIAKLKSLQKDSEEKVKFRTELEKARSELVILSKYVVSQKNEPNPQKIVSNLQSRLNTYSKNLEDLLEMNQMLSEELEKSRERERSSARTERSRELNAFTSNQKEKEVLPMSIKSQSVNSFNIEEFKRMAHVEGMNISKQLDIMESLQDMISHEESISVELEQKYFHFDELSTNGRRVAELSDLLERKQAYNREIVANMESIKNRETYSDQNNSFIHLMKSGEYPNITTSSLAADKNDDDVSGKARNNFNFKKEKLIDVDEQENFDPLEFVGFDEKAKWARQQKGKREGELKGDLLIKTFVGNSVRNVSSTEKLEMVSTDLKHELEKKHHKTESRSLRDTAKGSPDISYISINRFE